MMKRLTIFFLAAGIVLMVFVGLSGCDLFTQSGTLRLSLTDAPIDATNVSGVWITINDIQYHRSDSGDEWISIPGFKGPQTYNLLELTGGESALLGNLHLYAGHYTQIRFMLDTQVEGSVPPQNPGCYIEFTDGTTSPLFVPSGGESGYKATGAFDVPVNGVVEMTADFNVRKAVVETGNGQYILKPTIRLVVNNEAGKITGGVTGYTGSGSLVVYAYESGTWTATEDDTPAIEESRFPNSVTSAKVEADTEGNMSYVLPYLAEGTYDLIIAEYDSDGLYVQTLGMVSGVTVESKKTTSELIDVSNLEAVTQ